MDGALQSVIGFMLVEIEHDVDSVHPYLPFAMEELSIHGAMNQKCFAYITQRKGPGVAAGIRNFDILIVNEAGEVQIQINGFSVKALDKGVRNTRDATQCLYFEPYWAQVDLADAVPAGFDKNILLFSEHEGQVDTVVRDLTSGRVVTVAWGSEFSKIDAQRYVLNVHDGESYRTLVQHLANDGLLPQQLYYQCALTKPADETAVLDFNL